MERILATTRVLRITPFLSLVLASLTAAGPLLAQSSRPWPIKEFEIVAVEPAGVVEGDGSIADWLEEMVRTIRSLDAFDPDFPDIFQTVSLDATTKAEVESVLETTARHLESWGFPPPALEPVVEREDGTSAYRVYLVAGRDGAAGVYNHRPCSYGLREAVIVYDADDILKGSGGLEDKGVHTLAHELVHAAQYALPAYGCGDGLPGKWITEGTARAIGWDIARKILGLSSLNARWEKLWGIRTYSWRLPVPAVDEARSTTAYQTSSFWRFLAELKASNGMWPGPDASWPVDYSYLAVLLARNLNARDCYYRGDPCDEELRWIDAGLTVQFGRPLRELYARFMQTYAQYGEARVHASQGRLTPEFWQENVLKSSFFHQEGGEYPIGCETVPLGPDAENRRYEFVVDFFADNAAICWEIDLEGFEDEAEVTVAVIAAYRPGLEAVLRQVTAVMADDSRRVDEADVRTAAGVPQATWYYGHIGNEENPVFLLTNMADEPDATRRLTDLSVTFTALQEYVAMDVSGSDSRGGSDDGPIAADIAQPIDFDVAEGALTVFYATPDDFDELELDHPVCTVWIELRSHQEDALWVMGNIASPIRAGLYEIVSAPGGKPDLLGSRLWTSRTAGRGRLQTFGRSGTLEIEAVDHLMIEGTVWTHVHKGLEGGDVNLLVEAEFGLQPGSMVSGILGPKAADHPCFVEGEPTTLAGGGDGGDPNARREPSDGRSTDGRSSGEDDQRSDEDDGSDEVNESSRGGLPAGGQAGDANTPDPREQPSPAGGDVVPSDESSDGEPSVAGTTLRLEFMDQEGTSIRSLPQEVRGVHSSERVDISGSSFGLQLALHQDAIWRCAEGKSSGLGGLYALTGLGMGAATEIDWDGWYRIDISDAEIELDANAGAVRLELDFEHCQEETGRCQSGIVVVRADPGDVRLASTRDGSTRMGVSGATLEAELNRQKGACDGLVDFSASLDAAP